MDSKTLGILSIVISNIFPFTCQVHSAPILDTGICILYPYWSFLNSVIAPNSLCCLHVVFPTLSLTPRLLGLDTTNFDR